MKRWETMVLCFGTAPELKGTPQDNAGADAEFANKEMKTREKDGWEPVGIAPANPGFIILFKREILEPPLNITDTPRPAKPTHYSGDPDLSPTMEDQDLGGGMGTG